MSANAPDSPTGRGHDAPSLRPALLLLSLFAAWVFGSAFSEHVRALLSGPPVYLAPELVTIAAPASGSLVVVTSPAAVLDHADPDTSVRAENITSGATGSWVAYHSSKPISPSVIASAGDLIGLAARNGSEAASAEIGFVPAPSDAAPPDLHEGDIDGELTGTAPNTIFELSGPWGGDRMWVSSTQGGGVGNV